MSIWAKGHMSVENVLSVPNVQMLNRPNALMLKACESMIYYWTRGN